MNQEQKLRPIVKRNTGGYVAKQGSRSRNRKVTISLDHGRFVKLHTFTALHDKTLAETIISGLDLILSSE